MRTNLKKAMQMALTRHLKSINKKLIEKEEKKEKKRKFSLEEVSEIEKLYLSFGWNQDQLQKLMKVNSILHDAPELKQGSMIMLEQHCVVVCESNGSGHGYGIGNPFIVTYAKERYGLHADGRTSAHVFGPADRPRYATEEEIGKCVSGLTDPQWRTILTDSTMKPLADAINGIEVDVEVNDDEEESETTTLANGRVITVNDE